MTSYEIYDQDKVTVFRIAIGWKIFISISVAIIVIVLGFALFEIFTGKWPLNNVWIAVMLFPVVLFFFYGLFAAFKEKLEIYPDRIKYFGVFRIKELIWDDINGYRIGKRGLILEPRDPKIKKVLAGEGFGRRAELIALLDKKIVNLTALEYQNEFNQAMNSMRFGKTEEEKKQIIGRLSIFSWASNFFCIALMFLALFSPKPYCLLIFSMVTLPVVALILLFIFRGALGLDDNKRKPIPTIDFLFIMPCLGLSFRAYTDFNIQNWDKFWIPFIALSLSLFVITLFCSLDVRSKISMAICYFAMCFLYGASTTVLMNGILDNSKPEIYKVRVIEKKSCDGKKNSSYLTLSPWSELKDPKEVDVGEYIYDFHEVGDTVDVAVYRGKLGITWFKIL